MYQALSKPPSAGDPIAVIVRKGVNEVFDTDLRGNYVYDSRDFSKDSWSMSSLFRSC